MACKGVIHEYEIKSLGSGSINRGAAELHREFKHSMAAHAIDYSVQRSKIEYVYFLTNSKQMAAHQPFQIAYISFHVLCTSRLSKMLQTKCKKCTRLHFVQIVKSLT